MPFGLQFALVAVVLAAGFTDVRSRRIPNWLTLSGLVLGFGLQILFSGAAGAAQSGKGLGLALLVYVPLYLLRGMGAGDVKLMAAVGSLTGPSNWLSIFFATAIIGGLLSLIVVAHKRRLMQTFINVSILSTELIHMRAPAAASSALDVKDSASLRLPHAISIAVGSLIFLACLPHF